MGPRPELRRENELDHPDDEDEHEDQPGPSKKPRKVKKFTRNVNEAALLEHQEEITVTIDSFRDTIALEDDAILENLFERFDYYSGSVVDRLGSRRELVRFHFL